MRVALPGSCSLYCMHSAALSPNFGFFREAPSILRSNAKLMQLKTRMIGSARDTVIDRTSMDWWWMFKLSAAIRWSMVVMSIGLATNASRGISRSQLAKSWCEDSA